MKQSFVLCAVLFCWTFVAGQAAEVIITDPAHGHVHCINIWGEQICQVGCDDGYVAPADNPHAKSYVYSLGQWNPPGTGGVVPWADCVPSG
ncbi:hypothetical protein ACROYT_G044469 [Oculina patagonica]